MNLWVVAGDRDPVNPAGSGRPSSEIVQTSPRPPLTRTITAGQSNFSAAGAALSPPRAQLLHRLAACPPQILTGCAQPLWMTVFLVLRRERTVIQDLAGG